MSDFDRKSLSFEKYVSSKCVEYKYDCNLLLYYFTERKCDKYETHDFPVWQTQLTFKYKKNINHL